MLSSFVTFQNLSFFLVREIKNSIYRIFFCLSYSIYTFIYFKLIVQFRQEIDFEIDFIKLCKTKLNTTSLWSKRVRKIESSRDFWSEIEKTISLLLSISIKLNINWNIKLLINIKSMNKLINYYYKINIIN